MIVVRCLSTVVGALSVVVVVVEDDSDGTATAGVAVRLSLVYEKQPVNIMPTPALIRARGRLPGRFIVLVSSCRADRGRGLDNTKVLSKVPYCRSRLRKKELPQPAP